MQNMSDLVDAVETTAEVGEVFEKYREIHRDLFRFKLWRLVPGFLGGEVIDFHRHLLALKCLEERLVRLHARVTDRDPGTHVIFPILAAYCVDLGSTIGSLRRICAALDCEAKGSDEYSKAEYQDDLKGYEEKVKRCEGTGALLNTEIKLIRSGLFWSEPTTGE